jgi:hypothetical protein
VGTAEVHLATGFQNMLYDSPHFPSDLRDKIYDWVRKNCADERKPADSEQQFLYKSRKKGLGQFKVEIWALPDPVKAAIMGELEKKFALIFEKLRIGNTHGIVKERIPIVAVRKAPPKAAIAREEISKEGDD